MANTFNKMQEEKGLFEGMTQNGNNNLLTMIRACDRMDKRTMKTRSMSRESDAYAEKFGERPIWEVDRAIEEHVDRIMKHAEKVRKSGKECGCSTCAHRCVLCGGR